MLWVASPQHDAKLCAMINRARSSLGFVAIAIAMTVLFWWPLYRGAGFIGGDLYPYFFPQKAFYSDSLKAGVFPLWNDLSGFGYPILGESQTGAAYPFHYILYSLFDLNTAYNIEHLFHYLICFTGSWLFARRVGLKPAGAYLAAITFTYGWFPPRACLEWAILTGAWMPVALWCVESFLQTRLWRYAIGLSVTLGLQLLAGHYHLSFITLLLVTSYSAFRLLQDGHATRPGPTPNRRFSIRAATALILAILCGGGLAAVQVLPTWELKQRSTRIITGGEYDPAYGHMPPLYVTQAVAPWSWYNLLEIDEENVVRDIAEFLAPWHWFGPRLDQSDSTKLYSVDQAVQQSRFGAAAAGTNKVEAHFYCGMIPIILAGIAIVRSLRGSRSGYAPDQQSPLLQRSTLFWVVAAVFALLYATGLLMPLGRHLPGFSFFRGPGRYGIVPSLMIALYAGLMLDQLLGRMTAKTARRLLLLVVFASTCGDLWLVSRMVKYTVMVTPPRIDFRDESVVRKRLREEQEMPRLLAPGPNVGNLLGVSCVPWYMGMAPSEYVDPKFAMPDIPKPLANNKPTPGSPELIEWLDRSGVTHVLNFEPLDESSWHVELVWSGLDPLLNRVWARQEPIFLYRFRKEITTSSDPSFAGRLHLSTESAKASIPDWQNALPNMRRIQVSASATEPVEVVLTELDFPGWTATRGSNVLDSRKVGMFRSVTVPDGTEEVIWSYRPRSVFYGATISLLTVFLLASVGHARFWHAHLVERILRAIFPPD